MSQKTLKILLVISFAANLLVAGAVGGFFGSGRHKDLRLDYTGKTQEARPRGPSSGLGPLLRAMDRKDRRELGRLIQVAQGKSGGMTRDARQAKNIEFAQAVRLNKICVMVLPIRCFWLLCWILFAWMMYGLRGFVTRLGSETIWIR